ncbi:stromal interaction molecule 2 isoform X2, partial [Lates japonicus]
MSIFKEINCEPISSAACWDLQPMGARSTWRKNGWPGVGVENNEAVQPVSHFRMKSPDLGNPLRVQYAGFIPGRRGLPSTPLTPCFKPPSLPSSRITKRFLNLRFPMSYIHKVVNVLLRGSSSLALLPGLGPYSDDLPSHSSDAANVATT